MGLAGGCRIGVEVRVDVSQVHVGVGDKESRDDFGECHAERQVGLHVGKERHEES